MDDEQLTRREALTRGAGAILVAGAAAAGGYLLYDPKGDAGLRHDRAIGGTPLPRAVNNFFANIDFPASNPRISIATSASSVGESLLGPVEKLVRAAVGGLDPAAGMRRFVKPGDVVLVKPNVGFDRPPHVGATTHPEVLRWVIRLCREAGAREVIVTDNPIESPEVCFAKSGIGQVAEAEGAKVLLPSQSSFEMLVLRDRQSERRVAADPHDVAADLGNVAPDLGNVAADLRVGRRISSYSEGVNGQYAARPLRSPAGPGFAEGLPGRWPILYGPLARATKVIGVAPIKDHNLCSASMNLKNWYGLLGGRRNQLHQAIHEVISDLALLISPTLVIADATRVMMRNGPTGGRVSDVQPGGLLGRPAVIASVDPVACDAWCYQNLLGRDPAQLAYLALAHQKIEARTAAGERRCGEQDWQVYERQGKIVTTGV